MITVELGNGQVLEFKSRDKFGMEFIEDRLFILWIGGLFQDLCTQEEDSDVDCSLVCRKGSCVMTQPAMKRALGL